MPGLAGEERDDRVIPEEPSKVVLIVDWIGVVLAVKVSGLMGLSDKTGLYKCEADLGDSGGVVAENVLSSVDPDAGIERGLDTMEAARPLIDAGSVLLIKGKGFCVC